MIAAGRTAPARSDARTDAFLSDVLAGLRLPAKRIPFKYLYDERGSDLFERICELPEYYLTRTELSIMEESGAAMADALGPRCLVIEYGAGSGVKTRRLLASLDDPVAYVPIDISARALAHSAGRIARSFPALEVLPIDADYTRPLSLPQPRRTPRRRVFFYPGSSIGNFTPREARRFLRHAAAVTGPGGALLIGVDLRKDPALLTAAYDDSQGVTAAFTKNLLHRINRELDGDIPVNRFRHVAHYNQERGRVEIHLQAEEALSFRVTEGVISLAKGERIHVEYACKYDVEGFGALAAAAGLKVEMVWTDARRLFSVQYLLVP